MANTIQFVDSVASSPTVRLDVNDDSTWRCAFFGAPPPRLRRSLAENAMTDGGYVGSSTYGPRTLTLDLDLISASQDLNATQLQLLARELDRETNIIRYQPTGASAPVFFKTWRADFANLVDIKAALAFRELSIDVPAEPFALGLRETLNIGAVSTATGFFDVASGSIKGDVEAPFVMTDSNPYVGSSPGASAATLNWLLARSTRSAANQPIVTQANTLTMGTDTAVSGSDAITTFSTTASATRLTWTPSGATAAAMGGRYRLIVGATGVAATSSATLSVSAKYGSGSVANIDCSTTYSKTITPTGSQVFLFDFGLVTFSAADAMALAPRVELVASVSSVAASRTLTWDFVYLVPVDEASMVAASQYLPAGTMPGGGSYPTTTPMVFDGEADSVYIASSTSIYSTATPVLPGWVKYTGSIPGLKPGVANRFAYLRYATNIGAAPPTAQYAAAASGTLTMYYNPSYLHIRPATT